MSLTAQQRDLIITTARQWIGTPFRDNCGVRGGGVDCAHLCALVYIEAGVATPFEIPPYSSQWFLHRSEELFLDTVSRYMVEITENNVLPGDLVVYKIGRTYAHGAIVVSWPTRVIHAHKQSGAVVETSAFDGDLWGKPVRFFSVGE